MPAINELGQDRPSGLPDEPLAAAQALVSYLGTRFNVPPPNTLGLMMNPGSEKATSAAAQVVIANALTDIAVSLRALSGRTEGPTP